MKCLLACPFAFAYGYCSYRWWFADQGESFLWLAAAFVFFDHTFKPWAKE